MKVTYKGETKRPRYELESGDKFGKLTVIQLSGIDDHYRKFYLCSCECGNEVIVNQTELIHGRTKSCGCLTAEKCRLMGKATRKYPNKCYHCGATPHYSKGLCRNCYARLRHSGTLEYKEKKPPVVHDARLRKREYLASTLVPKTDNEKVIVKMLGENKNYAQIGEVIGVTKQRVDQMIRTMCRREFMKDFKKEEVKDGDTI